MPEVDSDGAWLQEQLDAVDKKYKEHERLFIVGFFIVVMGFIAWLIPPISEGVAFAVTGSGLAWSLAGYGGMRADESDRLAIQLAQRDRGRLQ